MSSTLKITSGVADLDVKIGTQRFEVSIRHHASFSDTDNRWWEWQSVLRTAPSGFPRKNSTAKTWALAYRAALSACRKLAKRGKR